jgi:tetratricopeptide (TPR) repeat protein
LGDGGGYEHLTALAEGPADAALRNERAWLLLGMGDYQRALEDAESAAAENGEREIPDTRAWARYYAGRADDALEDVREVLARDPTSASSRALLYRIEADRLGGDAAQIKLCADLESMPGADDDFLPVLRYLAGELPLQTLQSHRLWHDFRVTLLGLSGVE